MLEHVLTFIQGASPSDTLQTLGNMPFTVLFSPSESQKLAIQTRVSTYADCMFSQVLRHQNTDLKPVLLARSTMQAMESRFQDMMTMQNDLNVKIGDMKTRMDEKDGIIKDLKTRISDLNTRMDEKDGDIDHLNGKVDGLEKQTDALRMDLQTEKYERLDDMNALREVRCSTLIFKTFSC